jgi:hypothetical protein
MADEQAPDMHLTGMTAGGSLQLTRTIVDLQLIHNLLVKFMTRTTLQATTTTSVLLSAA